LVVCGAGAAARHCVVGFLDSGSPTDMTETLAAFHRGLAEAG
jgi:hypothetical protein